MAKDGTLGTNMEEGDAAKPGAQLTLEEGGYAGGRLKPHLELKPSHLDRGGSSGPSDLAVCPASY